MSVDGKWKELDGKWKELDDEQITLLSEGFCPWAAIGPHTMGCAKVLRDEDLAEYGYCIRMDALVKGVEGKPEILAVEDVEGKGWRIVECQT